MKSPLLFILTLLLGSSLFAFPYLENESQIPTLFPTMTVQIETLYETTTQNFLRDIQSIKKIKPKHRNWENTVIAWDKAIGDLEHLKGLMEALVLICPGNQLRKQAEDTYRNLTCFLTNTIAENSELHSIFSSIKKSNLPKKNNYYLTQLLTSLERKGIALPLHKRKRLQKLQNIMAPLEQAFETNIREDSSHMFVSKDELNGMSDSFLESLERNSNGLYKVTMSYPIAFPILKKCSVESTRKKLNSLFSNRAAPKNIEVLEKLIQVRDKYAKELGYESYASYVLSNEMIKNTETADEFLNSLLVNTAPKLEEDIRLLTSDLPDDVTLTEEGKIKAWDISYLQTKYLEKHCNIDDSEIAKYFPLENTIDSLITVYRSFFDLDIQKLPITGLWDENVILIKVQDKDQSSAPGYILLDLFPRENKYSHACHGTIIPAYNSNNISYPSLGLVVANFTKPTAHEPSLLQHSEVKTFFHEFGHAIHAALGRTDMTQSSGTNVKYDFVELPSQILEEWLYDPEILQMISSHYQTGEKLPLELIENIVKAKSLFSGMFVARQALLSKLALDYYKSGAVKDTTQILHDLENTYRPYLHFDSDNHKQASFGHLREYGPRYYGYLYSKVFALDLFSEIKKSGLLNPQIGKRYASCILQKGGEEAPMMLLEKFLKRKPNQENFLINLGL